MCCGLTVYTLMWFGTEIWKKKPVCLLSPSRRWLKIAVNEKRVKKRKTRFHLNILVTLLVMYLLCFLSSWVSVPNTICPYDTRHHGIMFEESNSRACSSLDTDFQSKICPRRSDFTWWFMKPIPISTLSQLLFCVERGRKYQSFMFWKKLMSAICWTSCLTETVEPAWGMKHEIAE